MTEQEIKLSIDKKYGVYAIIKNNNIYHPPAPHLHKWYLKEILSNIVMFGVFQMI